MKLTNTQIMYLIGGYGLPTVIYLVHLIVIISYYFARVTNQINAVNRQIIYYGLVATSIIICIVLFGSIFAVYSGDLSIYTIIGNTIVCMIQIILALLVIFLKTNINEFMRFQIIFTTIMIIVFGTVTYQLYSGINDYK